MKDQDRFSGLEKEIMLQVNERLFAQGLLTTEIYEEAKRRIVGRACPT